MATLARRTADVGLALAYLVARRRLVTMSVTCVVVLEALTERRMVAICGSELRGVEEGDWLEGRLFLGGC